jgi:hypothetical protein
MNTTSSFSFIIEGDCDDQFVSELKTAFLEELQVEPEIQRPTITPTSEKHKIIGDPITFVWMLLSIPGAILATKDIIDRFSKKKKVDKLIERIEKLESQTSDITIHIQMPDGRKVPFKDIESGELLDIVSENK